MAITILITSIIVVMCVVLNKLCSKIGIPALLIFILLGMVFGTDGIFRIPFGDFVLSEQICSAALIFIMFYGGFGTNWSEAKPVAFKAIVLSSLGVICTAGLTGLFCYYALGIGFWESMLIGSVISSTDAASVFSILRSKKLGLKYNTDSLLEVESGSNDPFSYMLTMIVLTILSGNGEMSALSIAYMIFAQIVYGVVIGFGIAFLTSRVLSKIHFSAAGINAVLLIGVALFSYALPTILGGNGYLSVYIVGIILGNSKIQSKQSLVHFFDGYTGLMQILIFFLLGLLATPSQMLPILVPAILIALFLTFVARPVTVFAILSPLKSKIPQQLLVSFSGLRGAASIVFAIIATTHEASFKNDVFHMVFCIVLFSILFQGSLLPFVAKKLKMTDKNINVLKSFSDYTDEQDMNFIQLLMTENHPWVSKKISDITLPPSALIVLILRGSDRIVPSGSTILLTGDEIVLSATAFQNSTSVQLAEQKILQNSEWKGKTVAQFSPNTNELVIMIKRDGRTIIPNGETVIQENDVMVINKGSV